MVTSAKKKVQSLKAKNSKFNSFSNFHKIRKIGIPDCFYHLTMSTKVFSIYYGPANNQEVSLICFFDPMAFRASSWTKIPFPQKCFMFARYIANI